MAEDAAPESTLRRYWELIDSQRWNDLGEVLDPRLRVWYAHTGETFDLDEFVRLNREYPGNWRVDILDLIGSRSRCVSHVRLSDGDEAYHVASFATIERDGVTELAEVWTRSGAEPPQGRRPWR